jgi:hypothetical protein
VISASAWVKLPDLIAVDLVAQLVSLVWQQRHRDTGVIEVLATAWHASIWPRYRPVLLEKPVGEFH